MHTTRFDLLVVHHYSDFSGLVDLIAPDAQAYDQRPHPTTSGTLPEDLHVATVSLTFEAILALAMAPGDAQDTFCLNGPDRDDHARNVKIWVRRGALRELVAQRRTQTLIGLLEQWSDSSVEGLQRLEHLEQQLQATTL